MIKDTTKEIKLRTYRHKGWEYILVDEDHTAWITQGRIGRCRRFRVHDHIVVDGVRYTITRIDELRWSKTLRHISIPDSIDYVDETVFLCFPNLRSIYLGSGVENFNGNHPGYNTRLSTIDISEQLTFHNVPFTHIVLEQQCFI